MSIYDYNVIDNKGNNISMSEYKNKVLLIVNTATSCGFTPQYKGLEMLYEKYNKEGFEILDFPCNQFAGQAPGSDTEIEEFCTLHYNTKFKRFAKIKVNGKDADPLYIFLKTQKKSVLGEKIKWNFTKFLVDKNGNVIKRYAPTDTPEKIEKDIIKLL